MSKTLVPLVVVALLIAVGAWYYLPMKALPVVAPQPVKPRTIVLVHESRSTPGNNAYLLPIKAGADESRQSPEKLWKTLAIDMAKDPETQKLLQKLFGGLRVKFVGQTGNGHDRTFADKEEVDAGNDVELVLCLNESDYVNKRLDEGQVFHYAVSSADVLAVVHVEVLKEEKGPVAQGEDEMTFAPDAGEAMMLAVEDYLQRHPNGWRSVFLGTNEHPAFEALSRIAPTDTVERRRTDLDQRIKAFAERYQKFLTSRGKK